MIFKTRKPGDNARVLTIVEELKDGFCTTNLDGHFIYMNRAAEEMFLVEDSEPEFNLFIDFIRDTGHINQIKAHLSENEFLKDYELSLYNRQDVRFPVLLTINRITDTGNNPVGLSLLIKDMTYIKKVQQQLFQAQKMESIGLLASGIAHEFNNILTGIIPNAELIKMTTDQDSQNYNRANSIQKSAHRAADIVKKLLSFARNDKGNGDNMTDFVSTSRETFDIIRKLFDKKVILDFDIPDSIDPVRLDPTRLQQIIMNLAINAKDAIGDTGIIRFHAENVFLENEDATKHNVNRGKYVFFTVDDNGHGIDRQKLDRIFDPFFTTKEPGKGTGLGLSIVYGIVTSVNGAIEVHSELGKGTSFRMYLPVADNYVFPVEPVKEELPAAESHGQTILIIDDEQMIREMASDILTQLGYQVMVAQSGQEGIDIYRQNQSRIDLVLLDLIMPHMNGVACFEKLKDVDPAIKVVVSSGISDLQHKKEMEKLGARGYLEKPFSVNRMATKLQEILNS
jgi:PAS domain S-box-containing protein